jgi:hypothetical protein
MRCHQYCIWHTVALCRTLSQLVMVEVFSHWGAFSSSLCLVNVCESMYHTWVCLSFLTIPPLLLVMSI